MEPVTGGLEIEKAALCARTPKALRAGDSERRQVAADLPLGDLAAVVVPLGALGF
jgi:hypothetical protein